jgi:6-phospho-beta-glucosidase
LEQNKSAFQVPSKKSGTTSFVRRSGDASVKERILERLLHIASAVLNQTGEECVLSVPNQGAISFLPSDHIVEVPCRLDARGAAPLAQGDGALGMEQRGLLALLSEYAGAAAQAALWGNSRDAIKALAANPLVMSFSKAEKVYGELAAAHVKYLPDHLLD